MPTFQARFLCVAIDAIKNREHQPRSTFFCESWRPILNAGKLCMMISRMHREELLALVAGLVA